MTPSQLRTTAEAALDRIRRAPRGHAYAARKGVVAAATLRVPGHAGRPAVAFRRKDGTVRLEIWDNSGVTIFRPEFHPLPHDLAREAAKMLDSL